MNTFDIVSYNKKLIERILAESLPTKEALLMGSHTTLEQSKQASGFVIGLTKSIEIIKDVEHKLLHAEDPYPIMDGSIVE